MDTSDPTEPVRIPLRARDGSIRAYALVDAEDAAAVSQHKWYLEDGKYNRYAKRSAGPLRLRLHRELMGLVTHDGRQVDHINGDGLDCRRSNMRLATNALNGQNQNRFDGVSRYRGVSWSNVVGKWRAAVRLNYVKHHLGYFDDEQEAAAVARAFRREHMPFANEAREAA